MTILCGIARDNSEPVHPGFDILKTAVKMSTSKWGLGVSKWSFWVIKTR